MLNSLSGTSSSFSSSIFLTKPPIFDDVVTGNIDETLAEVLLTMSLLNKDVLDICFDLFAARR